MRAIILAGGVGSRLWPLSSTESPKQFRGFGENQDNLLRQTIQRAIDLGVSNITVVGAADHRSQLEETIGKFSPRPRLLLEPHRRNTAAAIAVATMISNDDEPIVVFPCDHQFSDFEALKKAFEIASPLAKTDRIVIFGIKPSYPEVGYGYIKTGDLEMGFCQVEGFLEKPDRGTIKSLMDRGGILWNAGIFCFRPSVLESEMKNIRPDLYELYFAVSEATSFSDSTTIDAVLFDSCPNESFDKAFLETATNLVVVSIDAGWTDIGSWERLWEFSTKDADNNVVSGKVFCDTTSNCLILSSDRLIATMGVQDLVIVNANDTILVADIHESEKIKKLESGVEVNRRDDISVSPYEKSNSRVPHKVLKKRSAEEILITTGESIKWTAESEENCTLVLIRGAARLTGEGVDLELTENQYIICNPMAHFEIGNIGTEDLQLLCV